MQGLEIRSIFGQYSQHLVDRVTFKCRWNNCRLSVVYNTLCFRVFLKASSILETSSTGDQKCYGPYDNDNVDVHENVAEKSTLHPFKHFRNYPDLPCYLKEGNFVWRWREVANFRRWRATIINTKKHLRSGGKNRDIRAAPPQAFLTYSVSEFTSATQATVHQVLRY